MQTSTNLYKHHRFPIEILSHAMWLPFRFCVSDRDVEELLFERGVTVTYEAIRQWCRTFGQQYANRLRRRRPRPGDKWHLDEAFLTLHGVRHSLWHAVDQDGVVRDIRVQRRRDKQAATQFFRKLRKLQGRYSLHWERRAIDGTIYRHDNAPHRRWQSVATFPRHFHNGSETNVSESHISPVPETALRESLAFVRTILGTSASSPQ